MRPAHPHSVLLALSLLAACRGQQEREQADTAVASSDGTALPGLRSAASLPGLRPFALPESVGASSPALARSSEGVVLAWMRDLGEPSVVVATLAEDGEQWLESQVVSAGARILINWADVPAIGETASGRLVIAWPEHHGDDPVAGYGLRVVAATDVGGFAPPWSPDDVRRGPESGFAAFAMSGDALQLIWLDGRDLHGGGHGDHGSGGGTMALRSVAIDDEGRQQGPSQILDARTCECCKLGVGVLGTQAFAAYRDRSEAEVRDIFVAGPGLSPTPVAADGWTITGCPVNGPAVAVAGEQAFVAWYTGANDASATWIARARTLDGFAAPPRFDLGLPGGRVDLLPLADGGALIPWL
ncbi:MAG: hypothetical protein KC431_02510, partial [Myxococcales bacterium]|nr:hypothetical protein [Myxococcales bacterium]